MTSYAKKLKMAEMRALMRNNNKLTKKALTEAEDVARLFEWWCRDKGISPMTEGAVRAFLIDEYNPALAEDTSFIHTVIDNLHKGMPAVTRSAENQAEADVDARNLRDDLKGEEIAIDQYMRQIQDAKRPHIKAFLQHILEEEVHHMAELTKQLENLEKPMEEGDLTQAKSAAPVNYKFFKAAAETSDTPVGGKFDPREYTGEQINVPVNVGVGVTGIDSAVIQKIKDQIDLARMDINAIHDLQRGAVNSFLHILPQVKELIDIDDDLAYSVKESEVPGIAKQVAELLHSDMSPNIGGEKSIGQHILPDLEKTEEPRTSDVLLGMSLPDIYREILNSQTGVEFKRVEFKITAHTDDVISFSVFYKDALLALGDLNTDTGTFSLTLDASELTHDVVAKYKEVADYLTAKKLINVTPHPLSLLSDAELNAPGMVDLPWADSIPRGEEHRISSFPLYVQYGRMLNRLSKATGLTEEELESKLAPLYGKGAVAVSTRLVNNPTLFPEVIESKLLEQLTALKNTDISDVAFSDFLKTLGG